MENLKIEYKIFSRITSSTEKMVSTVKSLQDSGWDIDEDDIDMLYNGQEVTKHSFNLRNQLHIYKIVK